MLNASYTLAILLRKAWLTNLLVYEWAHKTANQ